MIILLSPAKNMRFDVESNGMETTVPMFQEKTGPLINKLSKFSKPKLMKLMSISEKLALLNLQRYQNFSVDPTKGEVAPAVHAFNGEVYWGLDSLTMNKSDLAYANKHLRMLSGLYGYLRPSDLIQPYRLEMGSKLQVGRKKNLYAYWKDDLADIITEEFKSLKSNVIINLASVEYFKVIPQSDIEANIITIHFREYRDEKLKAIQFNLKRARGLMARYIIENKFKSIDGIKRFNTDGYYYESDLSDAENWYFVK